MQFMRSSEKLLTVTLLALGATGTAHATTLGVVYLNSNTTNPDAAWISRGLADMLTTDLSKISALTVVQREQLEKVLKEQALGASGAIDPLKAAQIGKILGAQTLLTGSYAAIGRNVRVDLQLINAATGRVEGGVTSEGSIDAIFTLEKQLVLAVVTKLGITPSSAELQAILQPETLNNQAVILNYQAMTQYQSDPKAAQVALRQAVALDPNYAAAQQNLRTVLSVSGSALANVALLDADLKSGEIQAVRQAAELIKAGVRISDLKMDEPTTQASAPGMVNVEYTAVVGLVPGTLATVSKLLEPFSREGKGRSKLILTAPGIARGDQKSLVLAKESIGFLWQYLSGFYVANAFFAKGKHPVYINSWAFNQSIIEYFGRNRNDYSELSEESSSVRGEDLKMPASLLKRITTSNAIVIKYIRTDSPMRAQSFVYIDSKNARELGIPEGYLRESIPDSDENCEWKDRRGSWHNLSVSSGVFTSVEDITALSGYCLIYTKLNDSDFNPKLLGQLLDDGEDFNITTYNIENKSISTRSRPDLITMENEKFRYSAYGIEFSQVTPKIVFKHDKNYWAFELAPLPDYGRPLKYTGFKVFF
jgi:TolB-like protein